MPKSYKFPAKIGACADHLYKLRQKRLALQKQVDELQAEETALREHIINTLPKSEASGVAGKLARVTVVTKTVPQLDDAEALRKYMNKTKRFDLVQKFRLVPKAVQELWDDGKEVPGVGHFNATTVSLNKV